MDIIRGKIPSAQKCVLYGPEGIGKTTLASQFPDPLFIDTEGSTKHIDVARLPNPSSWEMLLTQVQYIKSNPHLCHTLVTDTVDWAERLCAQAVCARAKNTCIEDFGYGKGYTYLADEFGRLLNSLSELVDLGIHVVVTAHAAMRKFEQPDEMGSYDRWEMKLSKRVASMVREWADIVLFANYETHVVKSSNEMEKKKARGGQRVMYTTHHPCWDAKNRHNLADKLPFDYKEVAHCFTFAAHTPQTPHTQPTQPTGEKQTTNTPIAIAPLAGEQMNMAADNGINTSAAAEKQQESRSTPPVPGPPTNGEWEGIPKALADLMRVEHVTPDEIRKVVAARGYFPIDTPIRNYPSEFIEGALIGLWDKVLTMIYDDPDRVPF